VHRVTVRGLTFRVRSSAPRRSGAVTYVLIHGIGVSHRYLARLHRELARQGTVHSIDLPGFGGLPKPSRQIDIADMSSHLAIVLERLGVGAAVLVGHSMGAQWVIELALQRPASFGHVVVIGPVSDERHRTVLSHSVALAVDTLGEPLDGNMLVFSDYLRCGPGWYVSQLREMLSYPIEDRAALLGCPLLIIRGGSDPIAGLAWARRLRDGARRASLVVVPGHRHLVQHTAPRAVAHAILAFRQRTPCSSGSPMSRVSARAGVVAEDRAYEARPICEEVPADG
jgi:pimeloyl-ACP methyl ester carboxylesterase